MTRYRVTCPDWSSRPYPTLDAAETKMVGIEQNLDACYLLHTVEVEQEGGEWLPLHQHRARQILAAPLNQVIETPNGPLIKCGGTWAKGTDVLADAIAEPGTPEWLAALGPHTAATLTSDGRGAEPSAWCSHHPPALEWVRYERWSPRGCEAHGYVCPRENCRQLVQSG
jgi:hypothetical protein